jgi:hypothetical protein
VNDAEIPGVTLKSYWARFDVPRLRRTFKWLEERFVRLGVPPQKVLMGGPHFSGKLVDYGRVRRRIGAVDWDNMWSLSLMHQKPSWRDDQEGWVADVYVARDPCADGYWNVKWSLVPSLMGLDEAVAVEQLLDFARLTVDRYGYLYWLPRGYGPVQTFRSVRQKLGWDTIPDNFGDDDEDDSSYLAWWDQDSEWNEKHTLLRDVYPVNLLTRRYLDKPVHGTTLRKWIKEDAGRGTLENLNEAVTVWRPPEQNIGIIREALFRAGVLSYHGFFDSRSRWYREFDKPFVLRKPVPRVFRADYESEIPRWMNS